jgi:GH35 family endo-1,4-beta-xylanase
LNAPRVPSEEQWAKAAMQKYFSYGVSGNSFKWSGIQPQHTPPDYTNFDHAVDWTQNIDWDLRAHCLLWGGYNY